MAGHLCVGGRRSWLLARSCSCIGSIRGNFFPEDCVSRKTAALRVTRTCRCAHRRLARRCPRFDPEMRAPHQPTYPKQPVLLRFRRDPAFTRQLSVRKRHGSGRTPVACFHPVHQQRLSISSLTRPAAPPKVKTTPPREAAGWGHLTHGSYVRSQPDRYGFNARSQGSVNFWLRQLGFTALLQTGTRSTAIWPFRHQVRRCSVTD